VSGHLIEPSTTPEPQYVEAVPVPVPVPDRPGPMTAAEKQRMRAAAFRATRVFPGAVGEWLSRELHSWAEFGYRLGPQALVRRLVDEVLQQAGPERSDGLSVRPFSRQ
jgi:hypothetical protein